MKSEHWKKDRLCPVCGKTFKGTAKAQVCGSTCRGRLKRLIETGQKPEYYMMAKSKGQKVPLLFSRQKTQKEQAEELPIGNKIEYAATTPESYNAPPLQSWIIMDEVGHTPPPPTKEQIWEMKAELEKQKKTISERNILGGNPKAHALQKSMEIDKINDQIDNLNKLLI